MDEYHNYNNYSNQTQTKNQFISLLLNRVKSGSEDKIIFNVILIASYSLIVIVSLIGNIFVLKVNFSKRSARTTTNVLIGNLAVGDLLMTIMNIPFNIARILLDNWPFGQILCVLVPLIQSMSVYCSSITMMFIAIERYRSLLNSNLMNEYCFRTYFSFARILSIIWFSSIILSIPNGIFNKVVVLTKWSNLVRCRADYPEPSKQFRQALTSIVFITQYLTPICITLFCYLKICWFLHNREIVGNVSELHRLVLIRRKWRRIKMLITILLVFAVCWLPFNIFHLLMDFEIITYSSTLFFINHWFAMSSVCYNPFIYCWLNTEFRNEIKIISRCFSTANQRNNSLNNQHEQIRINSNISNSYHINQNEEEHVV